MSEKVQKTEAGNAVIRTILTVTGLVTFAGGCFLGIGEQVLYPDSSDPPVDPLALVVGGASLALVSEIANRNN